MGINKGGTIMSKGLDALKSLGEHHCSLIQKYESEVCRIPCHECKYLTQEEYDLLKEVLL